MKFCLSIEIQEGLDYAVTLAFTQASEAAGFDAALLAEHYYSSARWPEIPTGFASARWSAL